MTALKARPCTMSPDGEAPVRQAFMPALFGLYFLFCM